MKVPPSHQPTAQHVAIVMRDFSTGGQWGRCVSILCGTTDGPARALFTHARAVCGRDSLADATGRRICRPVGSLRDEAMAVLRRPDVHVIHEPNLDSATSQVVPAARAPAELPLILCTGRLVPQKDFALALQAFALLDPKLDGCLLILSEGPERGTLEAQARRLGLGGRTKFAGHVADIRAALASARLFLLSSRYEGYPAVLIEALAAGVPVVTTDCSPAIGEIMTQRSFGQVVGHDAPALARAIGAVLNGSFPEPGPLAELLDRHRLDQVAQAYLRLFDWTVQTRRLERLIRAGTACPG